MKTASSRRHWLLSALGVAVLQACGGGGSGADSLSQSGGVTPQSLAAKPTTSTSTAQAIWSDLGPSQTSLVVTENHQYTYRTAAFCQGPTEASDPATDGSCAADATLVQGAGSYYAEPVAGSVSWSCSGNPTVCAATNQPTTEPTPPAGPTLESLLGQAECTFWSGGALPVLAGKPQTGSTVTGANGTGRWTPSWTYTASPLSSDPVAPRTAFGVRMLGDDGSVSISLRGNFYGESAKKGAKDPGPKYSFSMRASDGSIRVSGVQVSWAPADGSGTPTTVVVPTENILLQENSPPGSVDFPVTTAAAALVLNGDTGLLKLSDATTTWLGSEVLASDWFLGNEAGGADGSALARVFVDAGTMSVPASGTYDVQFSATVKELSATGSAGQVTFSKKVVISGQPKSCDAGP